MRVSSCTALASVLFAVQSFARPNPELNLVVHEKRFVPPSQWIKRDRVSSAAILPVRIGLKQSNLEKGYDFLMDV
jgi:tripeptidyl-peptidase-1